MKSDTPLDYAVFHLSPKRSRCELLVSSSGHIEKLASGLVKPFVSHLKVAEDQVAEAVQSIRLDIEDHRNAEAWFTKGTLERFVRFVSTPEVLELVNTYDAEMSQLETAREIYSEGTGDQQSGGADSNAATAATDVTKKELLRAIDLRLGAVRQDLATACNRASAAGFNPDTVPELLQFADRFGAHHLNKACTKFISLCRRRPDLIRLWRPNLDDEAIRASWGSDMSIDEPSEDQAIKNNCHQINQEQPNTKETMHHKRESKLATFQQCSQNANNEEKEKDGGFNESSSIQACQHTRRLSVQDRINLFENKQKENTNSGGKPVAVGKSVELRRLSSDASSSIGLEKAVLRRWSGASDMSIDLGSEKKDGTGDSPLCTPSSSSLSQSRSFAFPKQSDNKDQNGLSATANAPRIEQKHILSSTNDVGLKDSGEVQNPNISFMGKEKEAGLKGQVNSKDQVGFRGESQNGSLVGGERNTKFKYQLGSEGHSTGILNKSGNPNINVDSTNRMEDVEPKGQYKGTEGDQLPSQTWRRPLTRATGDFQKKERKSSESQEGLGVDFQRMAVNKPVSAGPEQRKNSGNSRNEIGSIDGNTRPAFTSDKFCESQENISMTNASSVEEVQRERQSKGNQGQNDELKLKANELEKLFAEHMVRAPGDQSGSARRGKLPEKQSDQGATSQQRVIEVVENSRNQSTVSSNNMDKFKAPSTTKMVGNPDHGNTLRQNFSVLSFSDDSRGKFYEKYMQKRDVKLREEWNSNRAEKEAELKAMQDSFDRSRAEMKAKFSRSTGRLSSGHQHADKLTLFNSRLHAKRDQHPISSLQCEEDEDPSKITQNKKLQPNKNTSSTPRTPGASVLRLPAKVSTTSSARRRSEKPLAQSVPNFSDLKKENAKVSSGVSKTDVRSQVRNNGRTRSNNEHISKEEKPRRPPTLRKSSAGPGEFAELSALNYDGGVAVSSKLEKDISQLKVSEGYENLKNEGEGNGLLFESEGSEEMAKEEVEEEEVLDTLNAEACLDMDHEKPRISNESEKSGDSGIEIGDSMRSLSQVDPGSITKLPAAKPSTHQTIASFLDSPEESSISWNSHMKHLFSYPNENSDVDASMDSPVGSPAFWNYNALTQPEVDAAQMRKKWGSGQKHVVGNPSQNQSRKDKRKGFKQLLKFGRKNRGADSFVDWISATTSEGDDDTEDGRDPANRSSEDLRKSRMGFLQSHPSDDSFNENELFSERVQTLNSSIPTPPANFKLKEDQMSGSAIKPPRSFFSLSNFRGKGSDSKTR